MSKIQNEDIKSSAELVAAGGAASQMPNDSKIWVTASSINKSLRQAIIDGDIGGGGSYYVTANTRQTPLAVAAATQITATIGKDLVQFVQGSGGSVTVTAGTPFVTTGMTIGQRITLIGCSDSNLVTYQSNATNLILNGDCALAKDNALEIMFLGTDGTNVSWVEVSRRN